MQVPNFPNLIYSVSLSISSKNEEQPKLKVTAMPARYAKASILTANSRRISMDKLGKLETIAESNTLHIVRVWVAELNHVEAAREKMQSFLAGSVIKKHEAIQGMLRNVNTPCVIEHREYEE